MDYQKLIQTKEDEIYLIDIILFLQASFGNIVKSSLVCLLAGGSYYFSQPKIYEASVTIEMIRVSNEPVETTAVLIEKMKLPLYFSSATLKVCGLDGGLSSQAKIFDKIKPSINKSAPMVSFVTQARSTQDAKACLNAVISEVSSKQGSIAKPLLEEKKKKIQLLKEQISAYEEIEKSISSLRINNLNDTNLAALTLRKMNVEQIMNLRSEVSSLEHELIEPNIRPDSLLSTVYSSEVSVNKRPLFTLALCLALGAFLGLLVTGVMRVAPRLWQQLRDAEVNAR
jgi:hypothetical protein